MPFLPASRLARYAVVAVALPVVAQATRLAAAKLEQNNRSGRVSQTLRTVSRLSDRKKSR
jgi:hypothetical protein